MFLFEKQKQIFLTVRFPQYILKHTKEKLTWVIQDAL